MKLIAVVALLAFVLLVLACSDDGDDVRGTPDPAAPLEVRLGVVASLTGTGTPYGKTAVEGIELALKEINGGAVPGVTITHTVIDDTSTPEGAISAFETVVEQGVTAIIGPTLSNTSPDSHRVAQSAGIPVLAATPVGAGITETGDYIFRVALPESVVVPATLEYVAKAQEGRNAAIILDSSDAFSKSSADSMRAGAEAAGFTIVRDIDIAGGADLAVGLANGLTPSVVDLLFVTPLYEASAEIVRAIRDAGFDDQIVGGNSFNTLEIATLAGDAIEGTYVGAAWNPGITTAASESFVDAYTAEYGHAPDLFAAQGYSSVYILANAIRAANSVDPEDVRDAIADTEALVTPLGSLSMSNTREAVHTPVIQQYRNGVLTVVE